MSFGYKALAVGLVLLALLGAGKYVLHLNAKLALAEQAAQTAQDELKRQRATLAKREKDRAATARLVASARASTEGALRQNQPWADQPVPQEVQDALCKAMPCRGRTDSPSGLPDSPDTGIRP